MPSLGCWGLPAALLTLLCCSGPAEMTFEVDIWPEKLAVETVGSRRVNCSTSCAQPDSGGLETFLTKQLVDQQPQWQQYLVSNISQDTVLICYFSCAGMTRSKSLNVSVYQPPKQVTLKLQPTRVAMGTAFTAECRVAAVKPLSSLTLSLFRGQETLHNQTFAGAAAAAQEVTTIFNSTAQEGGGPLTFSCQAELDLRSQGGDIIRSVSEPQILQVYEPVQDKQMVIIVTVVSVLLFLFVTSILLCFVISQHQRHRHRGSYGVLAAWQRLPRAFRMQSA
ncbi:PREDICTED: intercellular adhesion molecule 2 [Chinchilla lanigera]|uniref:Intercellular adhesion molecule 2 n=1 Tax=Chinchilla lanigera TaxID=34839 RepID=A0A8C2V6T5_CHILA|nr:PREDICTED: intercellular adhesion molecule 2 [Chinchilla lanigera]